MLVVSRAISSPISTNAISYLRCQSKVNKTCCVLFKQTLEIVRVDIENLELELYVSSYNMIGEEIARDTTSMVLSKIFISDH